MGYEATESTHWLTYCTVQSVPLSPAVLYCTVLCYESSWGHATYLCETRRYMYPQKENNYLRNTVDSHRSNQKLFSVRNAKIEHQSG